MESNYSQSKKMRCNSNKLQLWKLMLDMKKKKNYAVVAVKHCNRHPECLWNLYLRKFSQVSWVRPWTTWSNFEVTPALSRRLNWMTPDVHSNQSFSAIMWTSRKRQVTALKISLLHHINSLFTYSSITVCCLNTNLKKNILELESFFHIESDWLH